MMEEHGKGMAEPILGSGTRSEQRVSQAPPGCLGVVEVHEWIADISENSPYGVCSTPFCNAVPALEPSSIYSPASTFASRLVLLFLQLAVLPMYSYAVLTSRAQTLKLSNKCQSSVTLTSIPFGGDANLSAPLAQLPELPVVSFRGKRDNTPITRQLTLISHPRQTRRSKSE